MSGEETPSFEAALKKLESIVQRLEQGELPLEESLTLYEEGIRLSRLCHAKLEEAEGTLKQSGGFVFLRDRQGKERGRLPAAIDGLDRLNLSLAAAYSRWEELDAADSKSAKP